MKPQCQRCLEKGIKCNYKIILQFREDLENQGKKFGREGVWIKKKSKDTSVDLVIKSRNSFYRKVRNSDALMFINFGYSDLDENEQEHRFNDDRNTRQSWLIPSLQSSIIPHDIITQFSNDSSILSFALSYYVDFIAPIFNPVNSNTSFIIEEVVLHIPSLRIEKGLNLESLVQYSANYNHVFYLILSLGSVYLSRFPENNSPEWLKKAKLFQNVGASQLRQELNTVFQNESTEISTNLLVSMVLLIMFEVADDCNANWSNILKLCSWLRNSRHLQKPVDDLESSLLKFSLEFLHYQESMGRTACKAQNSFFISASNNSDEGKTLEENELGKVEKVISWMGCERGLVEIVSDITDLSFERRKDAKVSENNYQLLCENIRQKISAMKLDIDLDSLFLQLEGTDNDEENISMMILDPTLDVEHVCFLLACELKAYIANIYFECCLLNKHPDSPDLQKEISKLCQILKFIILQNDFKWCSTMLWCVFILAVEISPTSDNCEEMRYLILEILQRLELYSLGNVNKVRDVISDVWKKRDLSLQESAGNSLAAAVAGTSSSKFLGFANDWELFVFDENSRLSLA